jgi:methyl-accepting chemotaxis protein
LSSCASIQVQDQVGSGKGQWWQAFGAVAAAAHLHNLRCDLGQGSGLAVIALAMLVSYLLSRHLLKLITSLARATEQLTQGDFSLRLATDRQDKLGLPVRVFSDLAESLQRSDSGDTDMTKFQDLTNDKTAGKTSEEVASTFIESCFAARTRLELAPSYTVGDCLLLPGDKE